MDYAMSLEVAAISRERNINETIEKGDSDIQKFYQDTVIFITGGSGFLGKQLVEKFFRSCKIKKIYLLMRPNKTNTVKQRLAEMLTDPVYDELNKKQPNFAEKIFTVDGDVNKGRLGLSDEMWNTLTEEVHVIIHGAATVSFVENLKTATMINVKGTIEVLNLGKACKRLRSYMHISTAFSHATRSRIQKEVLEKFYECPLSPKTLIDLVETLNEEKLKLITPLLIKNWPNTYTFTKAVAEEAVRTMAGDLPICIVRPSVVICTYREPAPGWIDKPSILGPSGLIIGLGLGVLHVIYVDLETKIDVVPVDVVNNAIIAAGWQTAVSGCDSPRIYTVTSMRNPVTNAYLDTILRSVGSKRIPSDRAVWYCCAMATNFKFLFFLLTWIFHYIPAYFIDVILRIIGHKLSLLRIYKKAYKMNILLSYFLINSWDMKDTNLQALYGNMSLSDRIIYNCDAASIDRKEQFMLWMIGLRKYFIKDGLKNTEGGVKKQFYFRIAHYIITPLYFYLLWKMTYSIFSVLIYTFQICFNFS